MTETFNSLLDRMLDAQWRVVSPGRVNLLGEHIDYNEGIVLPAAIDKRVYLAAKKRDDRRVILNALDLGDTVEFSLDDLDKRLDLNGQPLPGWALYPAGVAWALLGSGYPLVGIEAVYRSEVPISAGLSSSAAVEAAAFTAADRPGNCRFGCAPQSIRLYVQQVPGSL